LAGLSNKSSARRSGFVSAGAEIRKRRESNQRQPPPEIAEAVNVSLSSFFNVGSVEPTQPSKLDELNAICNEFLSTADAFASCARSRQ